MAKSSQSTVEAKAESPASTVNKAETFNDPKSAVEMTGTKSAGNDEITWTASEFVAHEKSTTWYVALATSAIVITIVTFLLTKDIISGIVILVGAFAFGFYGARQPRQLTYQLDKHGISIGTQHHVYEEFRSFAVMTEGAFSSIVFMPLKRFATLTIVYCAPQDEDKIVDILANRLPLEEYHPDIVDRFMRRVRF